MEFQHHQYREEELHSLMSEVVPPPDTTTTGGGSFTALLELPLNQAMELLVLSPERADAAALSGVPFPPPPQLIFPSDAALIARATKFSPIVNSEEISRETPKQEPIESDSNPNSSSSPAVSNPTIDQNPKSTKRKEREKKGKESSKKSKETAANDTSAKEGAATGEKLPYVHVRARRGQATNSHSLAERARREKINARMKLLQELVPGCNKISGTAMVLDEIINHVQALQHQVEFLSMRLAAVDPRVDFNFDTLLAAESGSAVENNYQGMVMPSIWPEGQVNGSRQPYQQQQWQLDGLHQPVWNNNRAEDNSNFFTPDNSLLSYDSSANSDQLKMEL